MKVPKPTIPRCAPKGAVWYGGPIEWFVLRLAITSKDLVPRDVTGLVGCEPDDAWEGGKPLFRTDGSIKRIPRFGHWSLELRPKDTDEWDCGEAMLLLLQRLPPDIGLWKKLTRRYNVKVTFALLMASSNKGFQLPPALLKYLGDRGVTADFDVYYDGDEKAEPAAAPRQLAIPKRRKGRRPVS